MKDILSARHRGVLEALSGSPCLLAFDYDGVLAPLVRDPAGAFMRAPTRELLGRVARAYPCAVVSGRAWRDTHRFVGDLVPTVVGNHGYEIGEETPAPPEVLERGAATMLLASAPFMRSRPFTKRSSSLIASTCTRTRSPS